MITQLNPKIFRVRIDDFFELAITFELKLQDTAKRKDIEKRLITELKTKLKNEDDLKKKLLGDKESLNNLTMQKFKEGLIKGGLHFGVDALASLIPGGAFLSESVKKLMDAIQDKI